MDQRLPLTVHEVVRLVNDSRTSVTRLAAAVSKHHVLAESVLRKANMSVHGMPGRVRNLNSAVVVLGFDALKETSRSVLIAHAGRKITNMVVQNLETWEHSMGCAIIGRFLAQRSGACAPEDAFIAGLFHDIGALFAGSRNQGVGSSPLPGEAAAIIMRSPLDEIGRFPHAHVGAEMAQKWGLAADVAEAIRFHHFPRLAPRYAPLTDVLHLAEYLCHQLHMGSAEYEQVDAVDHEVITRLGMAEFSSVEKFVASFEGTAASEDHQATALNRTVSDAKKKLLDALDRLPEQQRLIFALHYFEGLSEDEIALVLEMPPSKASAFLSVALTILGTALNQST